MLRLHKLVRRADRLVSLSKTAFLVKYRSHGHGSSDPPAALPGALWLLRSPTGGI